MTTIGDVLAYGNYRARTVTTFRTVQLSNGHIATIKNKTESPVFKGW